MGKIRFTRTLPFLLFGSCTDLEGLIPPLLFQIKMFSLCLMRGWYCRGISVEIEMYFDSIMYSIKTHQSDHCRMERRGREGGGGDAVWRGCSSGPRTPCTPVLSLPLRPHPDTGHRPAARASPQGDRVICKWKYSSLILVLHTP